MLPPCGSRRSISAAALWRARFRRIAARVWSRSRNTRTRLIGVGGGFEPPRPARGTRPSTHERSWCPTLSYAVQVSDLQRWLILTGRVSARIDGFPTRWGNVGGNEGGRSPTRAPAAASPPAASRRFSVLSLEVHQQLSQAGLRRGGIHQSADLRSLFRTRRSPDSSASAPAQLDDPLVEVDLRRGRPSPAAPTGPPPARTGETRDAWACA
jgi:hypothetical protein